MEIIEIERKATNERLFMIMADNRIWLSASTVLGWVDP